MDSWERFSGSFHFLHQLGEQWIQFMRQFPEALEDDADLYVKVDVGS